jgi:hypothetical protein
MEVGLGERMVQERGRWCFASWDHPWEGWFYIRLTVDLPSPGPATKGFRASTGFSLPVHESEDVWARDVAANFGLNLAQNALLSYLKNSTEEQVSPLAFRVYEELRTRLTHHDDFTEEEKMEAAASALRWEIDPFDFPAEALALRYVEIGTGIAAEVLEETDPQLSADLLTLAEWLSGKTLRWRKMKQCAAERCGKWFEDQTKSGNALYCGQACQKWAVRQRRKAECTT